MSKDTINFTIGEGAGIIITNIAQEHLLYNYDPIKAMNTITQSLIGCPEDLALQILNGDMVLPVDEETQQIICTDREAGIHNEYPKLNIASWCKRNTEEIEKTGKDLKEAIRIAKLKVENDMNKVRMTFDYSTILKFVAGDDEVILDELRDNEIVDETSMLVNAIRKYIEKSIKIQNVIDWSRKTYPQEFSASFEHQTILIEVLNDFKELVSGEIEMIEVDSSLTNYLSAVRTNDEIISKGIVPVDIMDNYSAGWLAPNGDFYGLNGEIANMLHIQLADALSDADIIPDMENGYDGNTWLEQNGWVKIHGNHILYDGYNLHKRQIENVPMTDIQIKKLYEYGALCHNGALKIGFKMQMMSATRFKEVEPLMKAKLFEY